MMSMPVTLTANYWQDFAVTDHDIEFLHNYLIETETPLTSSELTQVLIDERIRLEREASSRQKKGQGKVYLPRENYKVGEALVFPALDWKKGKVVSVRPGSNPELGGFDVIEVELEGIGKKLFAGGFEHHKLNELPDEQDADGVSSTLITEEYGTEIEKKIEAEFNADESLVRIAGHWFPRALLVDVNVGHLNLAEAVLEVANGEPLRTSTLMEQIELPEGVNTKLVEFSLNYALQEDPRFDEVGPAGQVLWCLERLEPEEVRSVPPNLKYKPIEYDRSVLSDQMIALEAEIDDELSEAEDVKTIGDEAVISLPYPHWRAGTLPVSARVRSFFPTAYESLRVRFTLVDDDSGEKMPAWVVRHHGYVYGLREWFAKNELIAGSLVSIRRSENPGEVIIHAQTRRPTREWVRTVLAGSDGGLVFAVLKQNIACDFNERMVTFVPDVDAVDQAFVTASKGNRRFVELIADMIRELSKLTPQGHVHAQELYSAINILRRCPPAPLMAILATDETFAYVGDLYFRLAQSPEEDE
jgi:hypothetical protein